MRVAETDWAREAAMATNPTRPRRPQAIFTDDLVAVERNGARAQRIKKAAPSKQLNKKSQRSRLFLCSPSCAGVLEDIGIVDRAPNSSDEDSGDDIDDDDIADEGAAHGGKLPPGSAMVRWSKREDVKTEYTENLKLVDRVFLLGDIVARANDQLGQTGIITGMRMYCDCTRSDGTLLKRVPTSLLQPLAACRPGALVVHVQSHWLGRVDEVYDNVQIQFDDGSICKVLRTGANTLNVHTPTMDEQTWFWPGMRVSGSREVLRRAKWTKGQFRSSYVNKEATVTRVQAAQALVRWLAAAPVWNADGTASEVVSIEPPVDTQRPSRLLELTQHHARSCWRLAEHATLKPADAERLLAEQDGGGGDGNGNGGSRRKGRKKQTPVETCVEVVACHTRVDIVWQDGTKDMDGAATSYSPAKHVDGYYEFWPQDYVTGKASEPGGEPPVGVIESVNHDQRICVITWRAPKLTQEQITQGVVKEEPKKEVVPVYEIAPHPDFAFKVGDIVLRLPKSVDPSTMEVATSGSTPEGRAKMEATRNVTEEEMAGAEFVDMRPDETPQQHPIPPPASEGAQPTSAAAAALEATRAALAATEVGALLGRPDLESASGVGVAQEDEEDGEEGDGDGPLVGGVPNGTLQAIGEVVAVGALLSVRWMDGSMSEIEPEEAYVVNTEEEDGDPGEEVDEEYDDDEVRRAAAAA